MSVKMLMGIELCNSDCMGKPQSCWDEIQFQKLLYKGCSDSRNTVQEAGSLVQFSP